MRFCGRPIMSVLLAVLFFSGMATASRGVAEGEDWLKWDSDTRQRYVWCYILAFQHGFQSACKATATPTRPSSVSAVNELPEEACMAKMPKFTKPIEVYSQRITEFYSSYPADRYAMIRELLDHMADSQGLTLEQIHERLKNRVPSHQP